MTEAMLTTGAAAVILPGQPFSTTTTTKHVVNGPGTYRRDAHLLSSLVGHTHTSTTRSGQSIASVNSDASSNTRFVVPSPGVTVLGRVTRVTARQANVSILIVNGVPSGPGGWSACRSSNNAAGEDPTGSDFTGVIRVQDVRQTDKDKVRMSDCFRPGDIVRASVISLGDARSYFLATSANHLGVVYAVAAPIAGSLDGQSGQQEPMIPLNWQEMQDPVTGTIEKRKVAKPLSD